MPLLLAGLWLALTPAARADDCSSLEEAGVLAGCAGDPAPRPEPSPGESTGSEAEPAATAPASIEAFLMDAVNRERGTRRLHPLEADAVARDVARRHARAMAARGRPYHNSWMGTAAGRRALHGPTALGENVGVAPSPGQVHRAFMASESHRHMILSRPYRLGGFGVYRDAKRIWVVEVFLDRSARPTPADRRARAATRTAHRGSAPGRIVPDGAAATVSPLELTPPVDLSPARGHDGALAFWGSVTAVAAVGLRLRGPRGAAARR